MEKLDDLKSELGPFLKELGTPESREVHLTDLFTGIDRIIVVDDASTLDMSSRTDDENI